MRAAHRRGGAAARYHDRALDETFDVVTFAHWHGRPRFVPARRGMLQRFGEPDWRRISRADVERLIGQELGEPACTCRVPRPNHDC